MKDMWYIVGLGNPGIQYEGTRHNIGRDAVIDFAERVSVSEWRSEAGGLATVTSGEVSDTSIQCILPETYMNKSGEALTRLGIQKDDAARVVVVHDDVDLPLGTLRVAKCRGAGGHNGIKSVIDSLGTKDFIRVRLGVAPSGISEFFRNITNANTADFLLKRFSRRERVDARRLRAAAGEVVITIVQNGVEQAMNRFNTK